MSYKLAARNDNAHYLASINDPYVWYVKSIDTDNRVIFIEFRNNLGDRVFNQKHYFLAWGINFSHTVPQYDNYEINAISQLLLKS